MRTPPVIAAALATVLLLPACNIGGNSTVAQENDRLRRQVLDLETKLQSLEGEREELRSKIAELTAAGRSSLSAEIIEAMPRVTKIEIDSLSGFTPTSSAKPGAEATGVVLYLSTRDGKDRFTQAVGTLKVEALGLPREVGTGAGPMLLGSATLTPTQLRDAYRSGLMGTHYEITIPLKEPIARTGGPLPKLLMRAQFVDALTSQTLNTERTDTR